MNKEDEVKKEIRLEENSDTVPKTIDKQNGIRQDKCSDYHLKDIKILNVFTGFEINCKIEPLIVFRRMFERTMDKIDREAIHLECFPENTLTTGIVEMMRSIQDKYKKQVLKTEDFENLRITLISAKHILDHGQCTMLDIESLLTDLESFIESCKEFDRAGKKPPFYMV